MGKKTITLPLQPIFDNEQFNTLTPEAKFFLIEAVYLLSQRGLLTKMPEVRKGYFICSKSCYNKFKHVFDSILEKCVPEMLRIKNVQIKHVDKAHRASIKSKMLRRKLQIRKEQFSDESDSHLEIFPTNSVSRKSWNEDKTDHIEREKAIQGNKAAGDDVWFKDD